jgi:RNA polymerase sigma factor (sigma-70 family)
MAQPRGPLPAEPVPTKPVPTRPVLVEPLSAAPLPPSDADLIAASRAGDATAYDTLYRRHAAAARNLARQLVRGQAEADDVVAETFAKILDLLRRGGGPEGAFRPYLLTAVRRAAYDRHRAERRQVVTDQMEALDPGVPFADPAVADLERTMIARAFASLPQRWQAVLWHTEIEGARPAEVATLLGLTANGVAALAYRAREGLRQAYLQMHLSGAARAECRPVAAKLGAYVRGGLAKRDAAMVARHLDQCADCRRIFAELGDVNVALKAIVAPAVLGPAAAAYLASAAGRGSAAGWVTARLGQVRHVAKGQHAAVVAASVATVGLVAAALALGGHHGAAAGPAGAHRTPPAAAAPAPAAAGDSAPVLPAAPRPRPSRSAGSGAPGPHPAQRPDAGVPGAAHPAAAGPVPPSVPSVLSQPSERSAPAQPPPSATPTRPAHRQSAPPLPPPPAKPSVPAATPLPAPPPAAPVIAGAPAPDPQIVTQVNPAGALPPSGTGIVRISVTNPGPAVLQVTANVSLLGVNLTLGL